MGLRQVLSLLSEEAPPGITAQSLARAMPERSVSQSRRRASSLPQRLPETITALLLEQMSRSSLSPSMKLDLKDLR